MTRSVHRLYTRLFFWRLAVDGLFVKAGLEARLGTGAINCPHHMPLTSLGAITAGGSGARFPSTCIRVGVRPALAYRSKACMSAGTLGTNPETASGWVALHS